MIKNYSVTQYRHIYYVLYLLTFTIITESTQLLLPLLLKHDLRRLTNHLQYIISTSNCHPITDDGTMYVL